MSRKRLGELERRRKALGKLSDRQLKERFWKLCREAVAPLVDLSKTHTSPSIERSVLMRMGIDSYTATGVVARVHEAGLLGKGAGHAVLKAAEKLGVPYLEAAKQINATPEVLEGLFPAKVGGLK